MPSIKVGPFLIMIHTDDHEPAHAHVYYERTNLRVYLVGARESEHVTGNMSAATLRAAERAVAQHLGELLALWKKYHD